MACIIMAKKSVLNLNENVKRLDIIDIGLTKITMVLFTLALITLFPQVLNFVLGINPWVYVVLFVIAMIRPLMKFFIK